MNDWVRTLRLELEANAKAERASFEKTYLKSDLEFLGATVPQTRKATHRLLKRLVTAETRNTESILELSRALWSPEVHELRVASTEVLRHHVDDLDLAHLSLVETRLRESKTWALVDNLAVHVAGPIISGNPSGLPILDRWANDEDFWIRRSAMLALLLDLRSGAGDLQRFSRYAESMLEEKQFFIRKAIGWVLREISKRRPEWVASWLEERLDRVSGLTLREASKRLPDTVRKDLLTKYREP